MKQLKIKQLKKRYHMDRGKSFQFLHEMLSKKLTKFLYE